MRTKEEILKEVKYSGTSNAVERALLEVEIDKRDLLNDLLCEIRDFKELYNSS